MGRFDALKGNSFSSSTDEQKNSNKTNNSNRRKNRNKRESEKAEVLVEAEVEQAAREQAAREAVPKESEWIKRINMRKAEKSNVINLNDPNYWDGPNWTGPMFVRSNKMTEDTKLYLRNYENNHASSVIIPYNKTEYSRNGLQWYDSWEETFTSTELEAMNNYEANSNWNDSFRRICNLHEQRREESNRYYYETGELDGFAIAEIEAEEYEEYCRDFDEKYGNNEIVNEDDLEDDYDE